MWGGPCGVDHVRWTQHYQQHRNTVNLKTIIKPVRKSATVKTRPGNYAAVFQEVQSWNLVFNTGRGDGPTEKGPLSTV